MGFGMGLGSGISLYSGNEGIPQLDEVPIFCSNSIPLVGRKLLRQARQISAHLVSQTICGFRRRHENEITPKNIKTIAQMIVWLLNCHLVSLRG